MLWILRTSWLYLYRRRNLAILCWFLIVGFFITGLWPFNFFQENQAQWDVDREGVHLDQYSILHSDGRLAIADHQQPADSAGNFSIELWLQAQSEVRSGIPAILALYDGNLPENFLIGQWKSEILIRAPIAGRNLYPGYKEIGIDRALTKGKTAFITITANASGTIFYLNGAQAGKFGKYIFPSRLLQGQLIVGNPAASDRSWKGILYGLALYRKALSPKEVGDHYQSWMSRDTASIAQEESTLVFYRLQKPQSPWIPDQSRTGLRLMIPEYYRIIHKVILSTPREDFQLTYSYFEDVIINLLGFMPWGFFFFLLQNLIHSDQRWSNFFKTIMSGFLISLCIELIQVFLPSRTSQMTDIVFNTMGTALGLCTAWLGVRYFIERPSILSGNMPTSGSSQVTPIGKTLDHSGG